MPVRVVVGVNWGDEGKGRIVDLLAGSADMVVRYQGGNNAGHTVVNEFGTFRLHLLPSGIFRPGVTNVLGTGMAIDLEALAKEVDELAARGVEVRELKVSDRAVILFPFHRELDALEEERLGARHHGSTKRGIAPVYGDRYLKKGVLVGEVLYPDYLRRHLEEVVEWDNLVLTRIYGRPPVDPEAVFEWTMRHGARIREWICDTAGVVQSAVRAGRSVLLEGQLGALRDLHYGMYPFVTSSSCLASFARVGGGLFETRVDSVIGVMKAYSTVIGEGPFVTELHGEPGDRLRERGREYGAATGRPRRVGWFDAVGSRYGCAVQAVTEVALTKLDVLSGEPVLKICVGYRVGDRVLDRYPLNPALEEATPVYEEMPGWSEDISGVRDFSDLPPAAQAYVRRLEELVGRPITLISVGPERESIIVRGRPSGA
ncbi:MAG TPA: adenylosuccinate synthase [Clostridiales bacterium]|mgnify:FL=1|nr:adenylosuccinate synthase [Clostridiales bacterium]